MGRNGPRKSATFAATLDNDPLLNVTFAVNNLQFVSLTLNPSQSSLQNPSELGPSAMHLLNLTLSAPTSITAAVVGSFSGTRTQEILASRGGTKLEILKLNPNTGQRESYVLYIRKTEMLTRGT